LANAPALVYGGGVPRAPSDFARGLRHGLRGAGLILRTPRLWPLVALPFALSLLALGGVVATVFALRDRWMDLLPAAGPLRTVLAVLAHVALVVVGYFLFLPLASIIAAPFNEAIAETVEEELTGRKSPRASLGRLLADLGRAVVHEVRKLLRYLVLAGALALAALFLPGIGPVLALIGGFYLAARFAAYDALDATLSRWGWSYDRKVGFLRGRRALCLGLGVLVAGVLLVPVLNALAMPLAAAGGASLAVNEIQESER
jgi:CysZ protein